VSLANMGPKMFHVSSISGSMTSADGTEVAAFAARKYGDSLGPREQRSILFNFTLPEETPLTDYNFEFKTFYHNKDKDAFVDTVFSEMRALGPKPPDYEARLQMVKAAGGGALLLLLLLLIMRTFGKGKPSADKASKAPKAAASAAGDNDWLSGTLASTENQSPKKKKEKRR